MDWTIWLSYTVISAANIVTPGPANLNTLRRAVQLGIVRVVPTIIGNATGLAVGGLLCAGGVATLVVTSELLWVLFRWAGVAYLAGLGVKLVLKREPIALGTDTVRHVSPLHLFREALVLAATNPKALLFFLAIFPQTLDPARSGTAQATLLVVTYCALSILSLSGYALLAEKLRKTVLTQARYDRFRAISGLILIAFAAKLALQTG